MSYLEEEVQRAASAGCRAYSDMLPGYADSPVFGQRQRLGGGRLDSNWRPDGSLMRIEIFEPEILEILQA